MLYAPFYLLILLVQNHETMAFKNIWTLCLDILR